MPTGNGETGQSPVQPNRAGGQGNHNRTTNCVLSTEKLANHLCSQIGQVGGEIIVGHLLTKCRYTQISKADWEREKWPTTRAVISSKWLGKSLSDTSVLSADTRKYLKATGNGKTDQPLVQSNRAGG
ncbi:hypothetical protein GBA52_024956 [Prunus armeniaca]|nr:hypothetical protein GBA52_024956 [Prunus armeniaca]